MTNSQATAQSSTLAFNLGAGSRLDGGKGFLPSDVGTLAFWGKPSVPGGVTKNGSNEVEQWTDLSGNGNHLTQTVTADKPTMTLPDAISFDGTNQHFDLPVGVRNALSINQDCTIFIRSRVNTTTALGSFLDSALSSTDKFNMIIWTNSTIRAGHYNGSSYPFPDSTSIHDTINGQIISYAYDAGSSAELFLNGGAAAGSSTPAVSGGTTTGRFGYRNDANSPLNGDVYELIIYSETLSAANRQKVENYLKGQQSDVVQVYYLFGQSNAVGRGVIATELPVGLTGALDRRFIYDGNFFNKLTAGTNNEGHSATEFGSEMSFVDDLHTNTGRDIYLMKYAVDGTPLATSWNVSGGSTYANAKAEATAGLAYLRSIGKIPVSTGVLWNQGVSDAADETWANAYQQNLTDLAADFRAHVGAPNMPFVVRNTNQNPPNTYLSTVRAAQAAFVAADDNAYLVDDTYAVFLDSNHIDGATLLQIGTDAANLIS